MTMVSDSTAEPLLREVELAANGDEAAFTRIVHAYHDHMTRVCFVICNDRDLADEAVQSAWPIAWRKLGSLHDPHRLRAWLVSLAANEARQLLRRRHRRALTEIAVGRGASASVPDHASRVGDLDLGNALARLSAEDRALLALRYVAGFDSAELGRATGRSASGTRARLSRLLVRLRQELGDD